jgi:adenosylcobyric acid synthase
MLGRTVRDPQGVESDLRQASGLGLLQADTVMASDKTTRVVRAHTRGGVPFTGYEIHMGATRMDGAFEPFARIDSGATAAASEGPGTEAADTTRDGVCVPGVVGTYLHGALEYPDVCAELFRVPAPVEPPKSEHYARLADWFARHGRGLEELGLN